MSQLLSRLEAQLAQTTDTSTRAELTARISCLHSRVGRFQVAQQLIAGLRKEFGAGQNPRASVWIMLAEGLHLYYDQQFAQALDRLTRAQFLAVNLRYPAFIAISSAWKAFAEYHHARYEAMAASLKIGLEHLAPDDLDTQTRVCMIVAIGYRFLGERDPARLWFMRGHHCAVRNGDQAAIEALMHNSAVGAVDHLRIANAAGGADPEDVRRARFELESAKNMNTLTQAQSLLQHLHLQDARLKMLEGRYAGASASIGVALRHVPDDGADRPPHIATLERHYCAHQLGDPAAADAFFAALPAVELAKLPLDDRIALPWMARELAQAVGRGDEAALHAATLQERLTEHRDAERRLSAALLQVTSQWTPDIPLQANDNIGDYY